MTGPQVNFHLAVVFSAAVLVGAAQAQDRSSQTLAAVEQSLEKGDADGATSLIQEILASEGGSPAVFYQIARIYFERELLRDADRAIDKALDVESSNVDFMELKLRIGFPRAFPIFIQRTNKVEMAEKILKIDPDNAYAHEVLGLEYEETFEHTVYLIKTPTSRLFQTGVDRQIVSDEMACARSEGGELLFETDHQIVWNMGSCTNQDRFDIEMLKNLGIAIVDASGPADRAYEKAIEHYEKSHQADPANTSVGESLIRLYIRKENYPAARQVLGRMFSHTSNTSAYWLYAGLLEYQVQNYESAETLFEQAKARMSPYYLALFEDPARIRSPLDDAMTAEDYWQAKDIRYMTSFNERRVEHYARMAYASLFFRPIEGQGNGWDTPRGRLLVRYGFPDQVYSITDTEEFLHKVSGTSSDHQSMKNFLIWEFGPFRFVFEDAFRTGQFELWSPRAASAPWYQNMDFVTMEKDRAIDTTERSSLPDELPRVEFPYLVNVFKGAGAMADIVVPYGVPLGQEEATGRRALLITSGVFLIDLDAGPIAESRTPPGLGAEGTVYAFDQSVVWTSVLDMHGKAGTHDISVEWETADGSSMGFHRSAVVVPDFGGADLTVSDLMLAYRVEEADPGMAAGSEGRQGPGITRNNLHIEPAPWGVFSTEQPVYVYFEAYGLGVRPDGSTRYDIEAELIGQDERGRLGRLLGGQNQGAVSVRFEDSGRERDIGRYLILDSTDQPPGTYRLVVRIHDAVSGAEVQAERTVILE